MTSTPVRSSDSLMNLVGKTAQTTFSGIKNAGGTSFGDVMAYRAAFLTLWHFAMQTAFCFLYSLKHGVASVYFLK